MRRLIPLLFAAVVGCAGTIDRPAPAPVAQELPSEPVTVTHDGWAVTVPPQWRVDETVKEEGAMKQILEARTTFNVGRGPVRFALNVMPFNGPDLAFAMITGSLMDGMVPDSKVMKSGLVDVDGKPGSLTVLLTKDAVGIAVIAVAHGGTGYVMTCGGDALVEGNQAADACSSLMKTFHVD